MFWSYSVVQAIVPLLQNCSPYTLLYDFKPDLQDLKTFGSPCYVSILISNRGKFESRAKKCLFLGFKFGFRGYVIMDLESKQIYVLRNITFFDHILPQNFFSNIWQYHTSSHLISQFFHLKPLSFTKLFWTWWHFYINHPSTYITTIESSTYSPFSNLNLPDHATYVSTWVSTRVKSNLVT